MPPRRPEELGLQLRRHADEARVPQQDRRQVPQEAGGHGQVRGPLRSARRTTPPHRLTLTPSPRQGFSLCVCVCTQRTPDHPWKEGSPTVSSLGLNIFLFGSGFSDRSCQFMCDPNYFMKKLFLQHLFILYKDERILSFFKRKQPSYHSLPLEKFK